MLFYHLTKEQVSLLIKQRGGQIKLTDTKIIG